MMTGADVEVDAVVLHAAADAAAAAADDDTSAAMSAEEAELAAKQAEAAKKERILAAALAQEDAGVCMHKGPTPSATVGTICLRCCSCDFQFVTHFASGARDRQCSEIATMMICATV